MAKQSVYFELPGLSDKHDVKNVKNALGRLPGVLDVALSDGTDQVAVDFDSTGTSADEIRSRLSKLGYHAKQTRDEPHIM